jgi:RNA polymerase sigma-70 factor (ECF subfamily)
LPKLKNYDDKKLITLIKQSNGNALRALFERYFNRLCKFAFQFIKNIDLCEEAVSDIFLKIWLKRNDINITSSVSSYLYISVRNQCITYIKKNKQIFEKLETAETQGKVSSENSDDFVCYEELVAEVESVLQKLPAKRQLIFRMNRFDGLKYKEIAEILNISVNTVQNQMTEAVKFLTNQYPKIKK